MQALWKYIGQQFFAAIYGQPQGPKNVAGYRIYIRNEGEIMTLSPTDANVSLHVPLQNRYIGILMGFFRIYVGYVGIMSGSCWILLGRRLWIFFHVWFLLGLLDFARHICWALVRHAGNCWGLVGFCWATNLAKYVCAHHAGICQDLAAFCWAHIFDLLENVGYLHHNLSPCCKMVGTLPIVYFLAGYCWAYKFDLLENVGHLKSPCWKMSGTQT